MELIGREPLPITSIRVIVYHQCAVAATGSALGPRDALAYWWATPDGLRIVPADPFDDHSEVVRIRQAVLEAIGRPSDAVRHRQDELAEAPEL